MVRQLITSCLAGRGGDGPYSHVLLDSAITFRWSARAGARAE